MYALNEQAHAAGFPGRDGAGHLVAEQTTTGVQDSARLQDIDRLGAALADLLVSAWNRRAGANDSRTAA